MKLHSDWILSQSLGLGAKQEPVLWLLCGCLTQRGQCSTEELSLGSEVIWTFTFKENGVTQHGRE